MPAPDRPAADVTKDFRGVGGPLNSVKTKMALAPLPAGRTLAVLPDEDGARNVPARAAKDGHAVPAVAAEALIFA